MTLALPRRERNRLQTWEAIHAAAVDLALNRGLGSATVEEIAERAGVSRRTFFNYFPTKEDAVLGMRAASLSADDIEAFTSSTDDLFGRAVRLMTAAVQSAFHDLPAFPQRRQLLKLHPELRSRIDHHVAGAQALVQQQIGGGADDDSRVLLALAGAVMRFAFAPGPDGVIDASPETIDAAIARFRHVIEEAL